MHPCIEMPKSNNTRKSSSPKKSSTRKSPRGLFNDPLFEAMNRGNVLWGNLMANENAKAPAKKAASRSSSRKSSAKAAASWESPLEDFRIPDLRQLHNISKHFPVVYTEIVQGGAGGNGKVRYALSWHKARLEEWRRDKPKSYDEWMEYQAYMEYRLLHSLRAHSALYTLELPRSADEIAVIAVEPGMAPRRRSRSPARARGSAAAAPRAPSPPRAPGVPVLKKLNDITTHFPGVVVWKQVAGRAGESTYALTVRNDFAARGTAISRAATLNSLMAALRASRFWNVLPGVGKEFARLEMRHD